jgi:acyl carrier protein
LTAERFVPNPFSAEPGAGLYRTGDLGRWLADGNLEFLGRVDDQVKIRGFRVEPGEVEAHLAQHPSVRQAVVVAREDRPGDRRLVAYVVAMDGQSAASTDELRQFLAERVPDYMLPGMFVALDSVPLNANGKVDRRALPLREEAQTLDRDREQAGPRTAIEVVLIRLWAEVLGREESTISIHDTFFDLGGHSLFALRLAFRIGAVFGTELSIRDLFEARTIARTALVIERATESSGDSAALTRLLEEIESPSDMEAAAQLVQQNAPNHLT